MLEKWTAFVNEVDPDVVIGYNIANFDLPYLLDRAKALKAGDFPFLGRIISAFVPIRVEEPLIKSCDQTSKLRRKTRISPRRHSDNEIPKIPP